MAIRGVDFKWYDGFFLSMLATSVIIVAVNWRRYNSCTYPLHIWIVVDYSTVFAFRLLMFLDNGLSAGMGLYCTSNFYTFTYIFMSFGAIASCCISLVHTSIRVHASMVINRMVIIMRMISTLESYDQLLIFLFFLFPLRDFGSQQRYARFCGRVVVLCVLASILYPFLWAWTVIGTLWFSKAKDCLPEEGQKWGFLIWLLFSYCGLLCIACLCIGKWMARRHALVQRAQQGIPVSEFGVLLDMIRVPDWAFEAAGLELRVMGQDAGYHPGLYLTPPQREAVEALIQDLPKFRLKAVPADCTECPICLEEFQMGDEVRGLPCAHNFHVACIDEWLRLNVKCPRCRSSVFPNLDLSAISNLQPDSVRSTPTAATTAQYARYQPASQSYFRMQGLLRPIRSGNAGPRIAASPLNVDLENGDTSGTSAQHHPSSVHSC